MVGFESAVYAQGRLRVGGVVEAGDGGFVAVEEGAAREVGGEGEEGGAG